MDTMKRKVVLALTLIMSTMLLAGCTEAERVSYNLSEEADNFNVCRQIVVVNNDTGQILYEFEGFSSINVDEEENQLEITSEIGEDEYCKDFIGLNDETTYVVTQIDAKTVDKYHYVWHLLPEGNIVQFGVQVSD
jgi:hypothetical protein